MPTRKKTGDPVADLPPVSRRVLERAPADGRWTIPYTVGRVFFARGWGSHLGRTSSMGNTGIPTSLFQLNQEGLAAAREARRQSRSEMDRITYDAVHEATLGEIGALMEDSSLDELIRNAEELIKRVEDAGNSSAGARGYLDALAQYRNEQEVTRT